MATDVRALPASFGTDAAFRAWCQGIAAQLVIAGLVKTTDTGQIDNTTILKPSTASAPSGYEIYRFNDTLQATKPIFIKIEYGCGSLTDYPGLWFTVGTATNGSGVLGGQLGIRQYLQVWSSKPAGTTLNSFCSGVNTGAEGRVALVNNADPGNAYTMMMVVERTHDSLGVDTGDAIFTLFRNPNGSVQQQVIPFTGAIPGAGGPSVHDPGGSNVSTFGINVGIAVVTAYIGKPSPQWVLCYRATDVGPGTFSVSMLGQTRTFQASMGLIATTANGNTAIRWD